MSEREDGAGCFVLIRYFIQLGGEGEVNCTVSPSIVRKERESISSLKFLRGSASREHSEKLKVISPFYLFALMRVKSTICRDDVMTCSSLPQTPWADRGLTTLAKGLGLLCSPLLRWREEQQKQST